MLFTLAQHIYKALIDLKFDYIIIDKTVIRNAKFSEVLSPYEKAFFVFNYQLPIKLKEIMGSKALLLTDLQGLLIASEVLQEFVREKKQLVILSIDKDGIDSRSFLKFLGIPILESSYIGEMYRTLAISAAISNKFSIPVAIRIPSIFLTSMEEYDEAEKYTIETITQEIFGSEQSKEKEPSTLLEILEKYKSEFSKFDIVFPKEVKSEKTLSLIIATGICMNYILKIVSRNKLIRNAYIIRPLLVYPLISDKIYELLKKAAKIAIFEFGTALVGMQVIKILNRMIKEGEISDMPYIEFHEISSLDESYLQRRITTTVENFFGVKLSEINTKIEQLRTLSSFCPGCPVIALYLMSKKKGVRITTDCDCSVIHELLSRELLQGEEGAEVFVTNSIQSLLGSFKEGKCPTIVYIPKLEIEETTQNLYELLSNEIPLLKPINPYDFSSLEEIMMKKGVYFALATCPTRRVEESVAKILPNCNMCMECAILTRCPAIVIENEHLIIDENLCIGCGLCEQLCKNKAITLVLH